jgi:hypothetical protein
MGVVGWAVFNKLFEKKQAPASAPSAAVSSIREATKETNKTVLDETKTSSGQTLKAVSGKLVSLDGQKMVLESEGDRVQVLVSPDAKITRTTFSQDKDSAPRMEVIALGDIRVGDRVDALVKTEDGSALVSSVNVVVTP